MTSPVIITFKRYPELGRLKVVDDEGESPCIMCACYGIQCARIQPIAPERHCLDKKYHYEKVSDK